MTQAVAAPHHRLIRSIFVAPNHCETSSDTASGACSSGRTARGWSAANAAASGFLGSVRSAGPADLPDVLASVLVFQYRDLGP